MEKSAPPQRPALFFWGAAGGGAVVWLDCTTVAWLTQGDIYAGARGFDAYTNHPWCSARGAGCGRTTGKNSWKRPKYLA